MKVVVKWCRELLTTPGGSVSQRDGCQGVLLLWAGLDDTPHTARAWLQTTIGLFTPTCVVEAEIIRLLVCGSGTTTSDCSNRGNGNGCQGRHCVGAINIPVQEGQLADGGETLCRSPALQDDGVRGPRHGMDIGMLEDGYSGIGREGVQEVNLEDLGDVGKKAEEMVQILGRQTLTHLTGVPELTGQLAGHAAKMADKSLCLLYTSDAADE